MKKIIFYLLLIIPFVSQGQIGKKQSNNKIDNILEFNTMIYNFGDILLSDGPVSCTFTVKNISKEPIAIFYVITSCGCTKPEWTKEPISPGKTGTIKITYANDQGAYPFDKTITCYFSKPKQPIILRVKGVVHNKKESLKQLYPIHLGNIGLKEDNIKCGNIAQGGQITDQFSIANIGSSPLKINFNNISEGLNIDITPNPIPANSVAKCIYSISAIKGKWGKNYYYCSPQINGKEYKNAIKIWAHTRENFDNWTKTQINNGSQPIFKDSSVDLQTIKQGSKLQVSFNYKNNGKSNFIIYKVDCDIKPYNVKYTRITPPSKQNSIYLSIDSSMLKKADNTIIVTLTTNSPTRPIIALTIYCNVI